MNPGAVVRVDLEPSRRAYMKAKGDYYRALTDRAAFLRRVVDTLTRAHKETEFDVSQVVAEYQRELDDVVTLASALFRDTSPPDRAAKP